MEDNLHWIKQAGANNLVVGSQARILYADCAGRIQIAQAFNEAIRKGEISAPLFWGATITMFRARIRLTAKLQIFTMARP
jgi:urocanate hydratase